MATQAVVSRRFMNLGFFDETGMTGGSDTTVGATNCRQEKRKGNNDKNGAKRREQT